VVAIDPSLPSCRSRNLVPPLCGVTPVAHKGGARRSGGCWGAWAVVLPSGERTTAHAQPAIASSQTTCV
jgi:hypothetical protein